MGGQGSGRRAKTAAPKVTLASLAAVVEAQRAEMEAQRAEIASLRERVGALEEEKESHAVSRANG
jgi:uncharacterized coiled-coil protein SlyX